MVSKDCRKVRRNSKQVRESIPLLEAYWEHPIYISALYLRKNQYFDIYIGSLGVKEYYAGTWEYKNDTFHLNFINDIKPEDCLNYGLITNDAFIIPRNEPHNPIVHMIHKNEIKK